MPALTWSFSALKQFLTCPRQYHALRVTKEYADPPTEATRYGEEFHKAAELYVGEDTPLPPQFAFAQHGLDGLKRLRGEKYCELKMGLREDLSPCGFFDEGVWWRGVADLLIVNGNRARVLDYKAGKSARYADTGQLELMALATFAHFEHVEVVDAALWFVVAGPVVPAVYTFDDAGRLWAKWLGYYNQLLEAKEADVWNPNPSGLCKRHCPVLSCPHNGRNG